MGTHDNKKVVYAALAGNSAIALTKIAAAIFTGSSAMFSEAIHSIVDTGNQALLLYGMYRARRPADDRHPFGYAREIYFWAFVVAILIFAVGAGVSIYEGVHKVQHPEPITNVVVNYVVLGFAMCFEGAAWWVAFREFDSFRGKRSLIVAVRDSKDPSIFTVLLEDTAAMLGLGIAFVGIYFGQALEIPELDGIASIAIGCILAGAAMVLARETKGLLIGEGADPEIVEEIRRVLGAQSAIERVNEILSMHQGPDDILVNVSVEFRDGLEVGEIERHTAAIEREIKARIPRARRIFIEAQSAADHYRDRAVHGDHEEPGSGPPKAK
ncbi:MAG TPA: cation transporter [Deltaproteobacteria bacterium]|nr:cation transporter [Deltaproteobacteria bacterium]